ncbi:CopG family transcriptional regulator [Ornithinimicrobium avium]|uniref:CopG family transcriptional regulator n=1 Tax=Ornithinimicrobium avium TaxID=2283195 RepID=A0A345NM27_9MICO|nr:CopG family transcriptional regulator [Ornithinimicrobium avium]AXH96085.1 CopG family transcriptional regulator [Ornithinimicrobium avium]
MRTTITIAEDVYAEMERLRREEGLGPSEALNALARRGMSTRRSRPDYVHASADLGISVDVSNVAEVLDLLDQEG